MFTTKRGGGILQGQFETMLLTSDQTILNKQRGGGDDVVTAAMQICIEI